MGERLRYVECEDVCSKGSENEAPFRISLDPAKCKICGIEHSNRGAFLGFSHFYLSWAFENYSC